jgi:DNA-binding GntR family transcriptional regulator
MNEHAPIVRRSLHGELVAHIRDMITEGAFRPGQKVPEAQLCAHFSVSRTPMREALKVLASEGLLQLLPNRGAVVATITKEEIEELFPIMGALEALAGELACARITDTALAEIRRLHNAMLEHYRRGEWLPYPKINRAIHEAIFAAAGNALLSALYQQLIFRSHAVRFLARKSPARWKEAVEDHAEILAALERRDGPALAKILTLHLRHKADTVEEALAQLDQQRADELRKR